METKFMQAALDQMTRLQIENDQLRRQVQAGNASNHEDINPLNLIVSGLPLETTEEEVRYLFSRFQELHQINMKRDKKSNNFSGEAVLCFTKPEFAKQPLQEMNGTYYKSKQLKVEYQKKKAVSGGPAKQNPGPKQAAPLPNKPNQPAQSNKANQNQQKKPPSSGVSQPTKQQKANTPKQNPQPPIQQPAPLIPSPIQAPIMTQTAPGPGNLYFFPATMPQSSVVTPHGYMMHVASPMPQQIQPVHLGPMANTPPPSYAASQKQTDPSRNNANRGDNRQHQGTAPQHARKGKPTNQNVSKTKLFVSYLPDEINDLALHNMFSKYGNVREVKLFATNGNKPPRGTVLFEKEHEAAAAMNAINGVNIGNRKVSVRYFVAK